MANCVICGKPIKNVYYWNDNTYGIECWKTNVLPNLQRQREEENKARLEFWQLEANITIETLRRKDLSKIKNQWTLDFFKSILQQYDEQGWLSKAQRNLVRNKFNQRDFYNEAIVSFEFGKLSEKALLIYLKDMCFLERAKKDGII